MRKIALSVVATALGCLSTTSVWAQNCPHGGNGVVSITSGLYSQNFDGMGPSGQVPPNAPPPGWMTHTAGTTTTAGCNPGPGKVLGLPNAMCDVTVGGISNGGYNAGLHDAADRALGFFAGSTGDARTMELSMRNDTATDLNSMVVIFDIEGWYARFAPPETQKRSQFISLRVQNMREPGDPVSTVNLGLAFQGNVRNDTFAAINGVWACVHVNPDQGNPRGGTVDSSNAAALFPVSQDHRLRLVFGGAAAARPVAQPPAATKTGMCWRRWTT
jgi:hypothetical protein